MRDNKIYVKYDWWFGTLVYNRQKKIEFKLLEQINSTISIISELDWEQIILTLIS